MLQLFGHPFSSYTWKALIPLYAHALPFTFRMLGPQHPENSELVQKRTPGGKFPVLLDGESVVFEATAMSSTWRRRGRNAGRCFLRPPSPPHGCGCSTACSTTTSWRT